MTTLNLYKIDANRYFDKRFPFALYVGRRNWYGKVIWDHLGSFGTREEAREAHRLLTNLPEELPSVIVPATDPNLGI